MAYYMQIDIERMMEHPISDLYRLSNSKYKHYRLVSIPKKNGEMRDLTVPDYELKMMQNKIYNCFLKEVRLSPRAKAYVSGGSTYKNAVHHRGKPMILKLDIRHFFDNILYCHVKDKVFDHDHYEEKARVLLTELCTYEGHLAQGAPTSPVISNIVMRDFDLEMGKWCDRMSIDYTRYCDDMTFSGCFDPSLIISKVECELGKMGLNLNPSKTKVVTQGQQMNVTGLVVNDKIRVPAAYRREIRQEMYYIKKYGITNHLYHRQITGDRESYKRKLLGRINYVLTINRHDKEMLAYRKFLLNMDKEAVRRSVQMTIYEIIK